MLSAPAESIESGVDPAAQTIVAAWQRAYAAQPLSPLAAAHAQIAPLNPHSRGGADALAAWQRWHKPPLDAQVDTLFTVAQWPWYAVLERARVETLAGQDLHGMAFNLANIKHLEPTHAPLANIYLIARNALSIRTSVTFESSIFELAHTPTTFWSRWFKRTALAASPPTVAQITATLQHAQVELDDGQRFAQTVLPLVQALAVCHAGTVSGEAHLPGSTRDHADAMPQQEDPESKTEVMLPKGSNTTTVSKLTAERAYPGYKVFTHQWDEEAPAHRWLSPHDSQALHLLDALDTSKARQMAHRLQRRLLAARLRHWTFDQEEGRLDSRRLARLLTNADKPRVFRVEVEAPIPEACVTLLVDQSGSMHGKRQLMTAQAIDLAVNTLQTCQIQCEVLGFTTRFGADNPISQSWQHVGQPGRLNALRHIVYKTPAQLWRRTRSHLGLLLRDGFGRENIDGEALHWAACRLMRQPQPCKILVVLSDGAPYDHATAQANGRDYLENHLREVIAQIELGPIHLVAIGAGQDVGRYYRHALTLQQPDAVAEVLFDRLAELLTQPV